MIPQSILKLQQYNVKLAKYLFSYNYKPLPADNSIPYYPYKNVDYSFEKCLSWLEQSNNINTNVCIIVDNFIVLDVDTPSEIQQLKFLSKKYNIKSNLVVKTRNGYHVYYSVDYEARNQSKGKNKIVIKTNPMHITAPFSHRNIKNHLYKPVYNLICSTEIKNLPLAMYNELRPTPETAPAPQKNIKSNCNYSKYDLPVADYLARLDASHYLNGDRIAWLRVLAACKNTNDVNAFNSCFDWSKQYSGVKMTASKFASEWRSAKGINNGYAWLNSQTVK